MLVTWLSWRLFFQTRKKAVAGKQAMWKNSPLLHDLFLCWSQVDTLLGLGLGREAGIPSLQRRAAVPLVQTDPWDMVQTSSVWIKVGEPRSYVYFYSLFSFYCFSFKKMILCKLLKGLLFSVVLRYCWCESLTRIFSADSRHINLAQKWSLCQVAQW